MTLLSLKSLEDVSSVCDVGIVIPSTQNFEQTKNEFLFRAPKHRYHFIIGKQEFDNWYPTQVSLLTFTVTLS